MKQSKHNVTAILSAATMIVGLMLVATPASWAQQKGLKGQLVGAWELLSVEVTDKSGTKGPGFLGPNPKGILVLDASGRFALVFGRPDRPKLKTTRRRDMPAAELGEAARAFAANFGTWSVNETQKMLIRKSDIAIIPNNDHSENRHSINLAKDELRLVQTTAAGNTAELIFRRAK